MMKLIYPDKIRSISMTNEDASFPAEYALSEYVKQKAKATGNTSTVTIHCDTGGAVAIFGTNAVAVRVYISSGIDIMWDTGIEWDTGIQWDQSFEYVSYGTHDPSVYDYRADKNGRIWIDYDRIGSHSLTLEFQAPVGQALEIGRMYAGPVYYFKCPLIDLKYQLIDYSILQKLQMPGAYNIIDMDQTGQWTFKIIEEYLKGFWLFFDLLARIKYHPFPVWLKDDGRFFGYMRIRPGTMPGGRFGLAPSHGQIDMEFLEVI